MGAEQVRLLVATAVAFLIAACAGPKAQVLSADAGPVRDSMCVVSVELNNTGGAGAAELTVTLRDPAGNVVGRKGETVELKEHERLTVGMDVPVGANATRVTAEAEVVYPPQ